MSCVKGMKRTISVSPKALRLRLVVARQVGDLKAATHDRTEELLAADGAADDQVAGVDAGLPKPRRRRDELAKALRRVDEAKVRDDRAFCGQPQRRLCHGCVTRPEALEVNRVRHHVGADPEDAPDILVDRDRRRREAPDGVAHELRAAVHAAARKGRAKVPDDRNRFAPRQPGRGNQRRVVQVDELEAVPAERPAEAEQVARQQRQLAREEEPAAAPIRGSPDVREPGDRAGVDGCAGLAEELGGGPGRAVDVRVEDVPVELPDQVGEARRRAAQLAAVVDVKDSRSHSAASLC